MGCSCSRETEMDYEKNYFTPFEASLNIPKVFISRLAKSLNKQKVGSLIPYKEVVTHFEKFQVNFMQNFRFFRSYQEKNDFNALKLLTLLVLLSSDNPEKKVSLLFDFYSERDSKTLSHSQFVQIIENSFKIASEEVPVYVTISQKNPEKLVQYCENMKAVLERTKFDIIDQFLNVTQQIEKTYFEKRVLNKFSFLLRSTTIRSYCFEVYVKIIRPVQNFIKNTENIEKLYELDIKKNEQYEKKSNVTKKKGHRRTQSGLV